MLTIPIQVSTTMFDLICVLEDENLQRMQEYDPAEVILGKLPSRYGQLRLRRIGLYYANPEQVKRLVSMPSAKDGLAMITGELSRGFKFRPELGDHDQPYQPPVKQ